MRWIHKMATYKEIDVELVGITDLLMHNPQYMIEEQRNKEEIQKKNIKKKYDNKEYAEKVAYKTKKGELYVPSYCLKASMICASGLLKAIRGRGRLKP